MNSEVGIKIFDMVKELQDRDNRIAELEKINEEHRKLNGELREENKRLTELCDRYEEEHSTTFTEWNIGLREQVELQQRIDKAIEYCKSYLPSYDFDHTNLKKVIEMLGGENE